MLRAIRRASPSHACLDVGRPRIDQRDIPRNLPEHSRGAERGAPSLRLERSESPEIGSHKQLRSKFNEINSLHFAKARLPLMLTALPLAHPNGRFGWAAASEAFVARLRVSVWDAQPPRGPADH